MKFRIASSFVRVNISSSYLFAKDDDKAEAPVEVRLAAASKVLKDSSSISLVYVKGLVCPSCCHRSSQESFQDEGCRQKRF